MSETLRDPGISSTNGRRLLRIKLWKTKLLVSGGIKRDSLSKSNVDPCGVSNLKVKANSVLCVQYGKWMDGRCAKVNMVKTNT